ncbi:hypothetical protein [Kaarinaea lacus]
MPLPLVITAQATHASRPEDSFLVPRRCLNTNQSYNLNRVYQWQITGVKQ